jgi:hypothetical protein
LHLLLILRSIVNGDKKKKGGLKLVSHEESEHQVGSGEVWKSIERGVVNVTH